MLAFVVPATELIHAPVVETTLRFFTLVVNVLFAPLKPTCGYDVLEPSNEVAAYTMFTWLVSVFRRTWKLRRSIALPDV